MVIDPHISYGRPVLVGTGIPTAVVAERYKAGESIDELAEDYGRSRKEIEEANRCELCLEAARTFSFFHRPQAVFALKRQTAATVSSYM